MATSLMAWLPQAAVFDTSGRPAAAYVAGTNFPYMRLNFDKDGTEIAYFHGVVPQVYGGADMTVAIYYSAGGAGDVVWATGFLGRQDDDVLDAALSAVVSATDTAISGDLTVATIAMPDSGNLTAGDYFVLSVQRTGGDGADTLGSDAFFLGVEVRED